MNGIISLQVTPGRHAGPTLNSLGYLGIVLLMVLENLFPPLPSELILPAAGFAAAQGELNLLGVVLCGAPGSVLGTLPLYFIGQVVNEERLVRWAENSVVRAHGAGHQESDRASGA